MGGRDTSAVPYDLDRRRFLQGAALAACAAGASLGHAAAEDPPTSAATLDRIKALLAGNDALTWVITGDSITHGALHTLGWRSYPEHFAERVRWELRRMRDVVINTGISGERTGGLLKDFDWRAARFQPMSENSYQKCAMRVCSSVRALDARPPSDFTSSKARA